MYCSGCLISKLMQLCSLFQTSSKVVYGREFYGLHPLYLLLFYFYFSFPSFLFFLFIFFNLIFLSYFCVHSFSFCTPCFLQRMPLFYHSLLKRFALKVHSCTPIWKVTRNKPERCSVRSTAALLPQENEFINSLKQTVFIV